MKLFAAMCGSAALMTAGVSYYILSRFDAYYQNFESPLPLLTQAVLWQGGVMTPSLLLLSAIVIFVGLALKNNPLTIAGGVLALLLMLGAATVVPAGLMLPMEKNAHEGEPGLMRPGSAQASPEKHPIHD